MATEYVVSNDGARIAFDVAGSGPAVVLLAGHTEPRSRWHEAGYVDRLRGDFTVIAMDPRGQGESDELFEPAAYAVERVLGDVLCVVDACGQQRFAVWGYSFGATIALRLAARSERVRCAVAGGSHFGHPYPPGLAARSSAQALAVHEAKLAGRLDELPITAEQRATARRLNIPAHIACLRALPGWPAVEPGDLRCPTLIYAGALDAAVVEPMAAYDVDALASAGVRYAVLDGLDHAGEFSAPEAVLPLVLPFLRAWARAC